MKGARPRGAPPDSTPNQFHSIVWAVRTFAPQRHSQVPRMTSASVEKFRQHDRKQRAEAIPFIARQVEHPPLRCHPSPPQQFVGQQISQACHHPLIGQHRFDRCTSMAE